MQGLPCGISTLYSLALCKKMRYNKDMKFYKPKSELYLPYGTDAAAELKRTTHMAVAAHQDDVEIMAFEGITQAHLKKDKRFCAVVVTDGSGSARDGRYADFTDDDMKDIRRREQKNAANLGDYGSLVLLDYTSAEIKDPKDANFGKDLDKLFALATPEVVYTHNPADKHDTHVAVFVKTLAALRALSAAKRPRKVLGCEVWRGLDWVDDTDKIAMDVSWFDPLSVALLSAFDSQVAGGKRYDLAAEGRRRANATFFASHGVDTADKLIFALDLTPLLNGGDIMDFVLGHIKKFEKDVTDRLKKFL